MGNTNKVKKKKNFDRHKIKGQRIMSIKKNNNIEKGIKKQKIKKEHFRTIVVLLSLLGLTLLSFCVYSFTKYIVAKNKDALRIKREREIEEQINEITEKYNKTVKTNDETVLYSLDDDEYKEIGKIGKDVILTLDDIEINENTLYFPISNLSLNNKYYVSYKDVNPIKNSFKNERYKNYIPFNKSVKTKTTRLYKDGEVQYELPESYTFPIYIIESDRYYVEFNNELLYLKNDSDIAKISDVINSSTPKATSVGTILYHFIYDPSVEKCNEIICQTTTQVQTHIDFLKSKNYFTVTMKEFELFIDKKINLPVNSILITLDDGGYAQNAKKIFTDNKMNATFFIVSSWFNPKDFETDYVEVHSHTDAMHVTGICPNTEQGGPLTCWPKDRMLADLKLSREKTNMTTAISYPFYEYNDYAIDVLKEAGFTLGFAGMYAGGSMKAYPGYDKFRIPRITILNDTTVGDLAQIF